MPYANRSQASMCFHISTHSLASAGLKTESPGMQRREPQGRSLVETKVSPEEPPLRFCWGPGWAWYVAVPLDQKVLCSQAGLSHLVFFLGGTPTCFAVLNQRLSTTFNHKAPNTKGCRTKPCKKDHPPHWSGGGNFAAQTSSLLETACLTQEKS